MVTDPTQQFYESHAAEYESNTRNLQPDELIDLFIKRLPANGTVLDLGCAFGRDCLTFAKRGFRVTGLDYSAPLLQRAMELVPQATFLRQDFRRLTLDASAFDGIWAYTSLLHVEKRLLPHILTSLHRSLKPHGILGVGLREGEGEGMIADARYEGAKKYYAFFTEQEFHKYLTKAGFSIEWSRAWKTGIAYQDKPMLEVLAARMENN
jgi:SAM-dependent methyltransferase